MDQASPLYQSLLQLLLPDPSTSMSTPRSTPPEDSRLASTIPFSHQPHWVTASPPTGQERYVSPDPSPTYTAGGPRGPANSYPFPYQGSYPRQYPKQVAPHHGQNGIQGSDEDTGRRSSGESKKRASKRVEGKQPTFLTKLYQILSTPEYNPIIRWDEVGDTIIIEKPEVLATKILPLVYRQSRFASFSRQLNIYGFMRKVSLRHVEKDITDPDASTWSHPFLKRSSTAAEVQAFKRRVPPRPAQNNKRRVSNGTYEDNTMPSLSPSPSAQGTYQSPPEALMYHPRQLGSLGENEPAFSFHPSFGSSYPPPVHHAAFAPPSRPVYYLTSSSGGSDFGGSLPSRPPYYGSLSSDRMPPSLEQGQTGLPIPPGSSTSSVFMPTMTNGHSLNTSVPGVAFPQTAPPQACSFPELAKITQGHIRTRSVQGEPPSATLLSLIEPGDPTWDNYHPDPNDPILRMGGEAPTYQITDGSTWFRRGYNDIYTGQPVSPPLSHDFAPTLLSPETPAGGFDTQQGHGQQGYTYKPYVPSTPRVMPIRSEREHRGSISSGPYSPRSRPSPELSLSGLLNFGRGGSGSRGRPSGQGPDKRVAEDRMDVEVDDLPSASVRFRHGGLFDGVLREGQGVMGPE